jgi:hypothetical protein
VSGPAWLREHLERTGVTVGGVGTNLTARVCPRCKAKVVVALTPERIAHRFTLDPVPVSPLGELQAVLSGRATVDTVRRGPRKVEINHRRPWHIATKPPGTLRGVVLAEHRCGAPPLAAAPPSPADRLPPNSPPPF